MGELLAEERAAAAAKRVTGPEEDGEGEVFLVSVILGCFVFSSWSCRGNNGACRCRAIVEIAGRLTRIFMRLGQTQRR